MNDPMVIVWTFADEQRWEGPFERWLAEVVSSCVPAGATHCKLFPWPFPLRRLSA